MVFSLILSPQHLTYLSINPKSASLLVQLNGSHPCHFSCLLDVVAVAPDGQAHQIRSDSELLLERRHQVSGALHKHNHSIIRITLVL